MQLRSARRLATPPAPAPRGGAPGEDRLSGLPDELLLKVLARLGCVRQAARTSALSSRWRGLWTELRDLTFYGADPPAALAMVRPDLNRLRLGKLGSKRISLRLRAAAQLAPADLLVSVDYDCYDRGLIEMPVFKRATSITLFIDRFDISLPPAGNFDKLEHLVLRGYCSVNHSVFLSRCPRLRELEIISPVQNKECSSENCYCDQAGCWRNGQISFPNLEVVEFVIFRAADNEVDFLKFIFRSAPRLKRVTIKQCNEVSPSDRGYQELCSILEANASVKCI